MNRVIWLKRAYLPCHPVCFIRAGPPIAGKSDANDPAIPLQLIYAVVRAGPGIIQKVVAGPEPMRQILRDPFEHFPREERRNFRIFARLLLEDGWSRRFRR